MAWFNLQSVCTTIKIQAIGPERLGVTAVHICLKKTKKIFLGLLLILYNSELYCVLINHILLKSIVLHKLCSSLTINKESGAQDSEAQLFKECSVWQMEGNTPTLCKGKGIASVSSCTFSRLVKDKIVYQ